MQQNLRHNNLVGTAKRGGMIMFCAKLAAETKGTTMGTTLKRKRPKP